MVNRLQELNRETVGVIERVRSSLVEIRNSGGAIGSAVIWHSDGVLIDLPPQTLPHAMLVWPSP